MSNPQKALRFQVALSFPGEHRARVERIAEALAETINKQEILYDKWHQAEFARPNLDVYLPSLYHNDSLLLVFFLSGAFSAKEWCGLEWRAGRDLLKKREDDRLMFLRLDSADVPGLYSIDGYIDINLMSDADVAQQIKGRLRFLSTADLKTIEDMVQVLRTQTWEDIEDRCGKVRILTMEQPIGLASIYTDVHLLERRPAYDRKTRDELVEEFGRGLIETPVRTNRETVREVVWRVIEGHRRVIIYGKPGAGKTTVLKHIAMKCGTGEIHADLVPVFITLKDFAEADGSPGLFGYIQRQWANHSTTLTILHQGHALILLDGLDEVHEQDFPRVRQAIERFAGEFLRCTIVLSCRIAAREYAFERFTEVEIADFTTSQIQRFAEQWFTAQGKGERARFFIEKLRANQPILALASSPLLLTLLLLVFQERNDFGGTRSELYREAVEILLRKWDAKRGIERDRPYRLSITDMEILITEIAYRRFVASEYFFEQGSLEGQIDRFFNERNLLQYGDEFLADRILNSIESQIGLLIQRAVRVYSFSHLTFQEYLAAARIAKKPTLISEVGSFIGHPQWRELWLLLVTMVDADDIIIQLKKQVDMSVSKDSAIQTYLGWCGRKALEQERDVSPPAMRALFFSFGLPSEQELSGILTQANDQTRVLNNERERDGKTQLEVAIIVGSATTLVADRGLDAARDSDLAEVRRCEISLAESLDSSVMYGFIEDEDVALDLALRLEHELERPVNFYVRDAITRAVARALERAERASKPSVPAMSAALAVLRRELESREFETECRHELESVAIKYRDIGHQWGWTNTNLQQLDYYYKGNQILIECMNATRSLTTKTRQYVENTMLLPWNKLETTLSDAI